VEGGWFWVGGKVLWRQPPQLEADPHHQSQLTGLDRLAPRTSLGSVVPLIEIKYCEDTRPEQQLQAAHAQHGHLVCSIQDASGHSNVLKAGKAEDLKNARKRRTARKAN